MPKMYQHDKGMEGTVLQEVANEWHDDLVRQDVKVAVIMIEASTDGHGQPTCAAVMHAGAAAYAKIKINGDRDRILTGYSAVIEIDRLRWNELPEESQRALLDHELEHLIVKRDSTGHFIRNDDQRVKLEMRPDDWVLTGFASVARRHGVHSLESRGFEDVFRVHQLEFDFVTAAA